MAIAKIVFKDLSTQVLRYTAIGGIRFYDSNNEQIDTIGSEIITDTLTKFESEVLIATVTNAYSNGDNYYIGNAIRTDRPQTGQFGDKFYWLSAYDNQTITITFKNPIPAISKIEFNPRPDSKYTNRGIDQNFTIEAYDENDNLLASYNITPKYDTVNYIQTVETPELNLVAKYIFVNNSGEIFLFDSENNTLVKDDSVTYETVTKNYILENGVVGLLNIDKDTLVENNIVKILAAVDDNVNYSFINLVVKANPKPLLIVQRDPIPLYGYESINSIALNYSGSGNIKLLITRDFQNWYTYNGTEFVIAKSGALDYLNEEDINLVLENGITPQTLNDLSWEEIKQIYADNNYIPDRIGFAIAIENTDVDNPIKISEIVLNLTPQAFWKDVTKDCTIEQGYSTIIVTINSEGVFKINYQD
jgi:hypothetical protein